MDREVDAMGYGICIFSADTVQDFLKREKIRKRKLLSLLQKDKELYLSTQKEGILIPLVGITQSGSKDGTSRLTTGGHKRLTMTDLIWKLKTGCGFPISGSLSLLSRKYIMKRKKNFTLRRDSLNRWSGTARHGNGGIRRKRERESLLKFIQISNMMSLPENICCLSKVMSERKNRSTLFRIVAFIFR